MKKTSLLLIMVFLYFAGTVNAAIELKWSATAGETKKIDNIVANGYFVVDWGAGDEENMALQYEYEEAGDYTVIVSGEITTFQLTDASVSGVKSIRITEEDNNLEQLLIWWNPQLAELDIRNAKALYRLDITGNSFSHLDISQNTSLATLDMKISQVSSFDLADVYPNLRTVDLNTMSSLGACEMNRLYEAFPDLTETGEEGNIYSINAKGDLTSDPTIITNKGWRFGNGGLGDGSAVCDGNYPDPDKVDYTIEIKWPVEEAGEEKNIVAIAGWAAIDWGDGTREPIMDVISHVYDQPGEYTVKVGGASAISMGTATKVTSIAVVKADTALKILNAWDNTGLVNVDVKNAENLNTLDITATPVPTLDISGNPLLTKLEIKGMKQLESLTVAEVYPNLRWVDLNNTILLGACELNKLWTALPDLTLLEGETGTLFAINSLGAETCDPMIATNKGWTFGNGGDGDGSAICETSINPLENSDMIVYSQGERIYIYGVAPGTQVNLYNISGILCASQCASGNELDFNVQQGLYIVKAGSFVQKVLVVK